MKNIFKLLLAFAIVASFAFTNFSETHPKKTITVVIDAGHGGNDQGMTVGEITEKEIVASIAQKIRDNNKNKNVIIHLTRTDDNFITLQDRTDFINNLKPDLVLSLHVNGNKNTEVSGVELYVSPNNTMYEKSKEIASALHSRFINNHNLESKGVKDANFTILRNAASPAITVEFGYLSNENDRKYLTDDNQQEKFAATLLEVIATL